MRRNFLLLVNGIIVMLLCVVSVHAQQKDDVVGFWISAQKNVIVQIYPDSISFRGKLVWFDDTDDPSKPMHTRQDVNNPVPALRNRLVLGIDVLKGLVFDPKCKCWKDGKIYDVMTGKTWDAGITAESIDRLRVRGYWHFQVFGRSMSFTRFQPPSPAK
jgi:uncharacterized protein (DUF2147 family)